MEELDQKLLSIIQENFPISTRPYAKLGEVLGISEEEVLHRIKGLKDQGIIRRLGGVFDSRKLGYHSTLCAMEVPKEQLDQVIKVVNSYLGVTHNYLRKHDYNLWFTLITPSPQCLKQILEDIEGATGLRIYNLPAHKLFKIKVNFSVPKMGGA